MISQAEIFEYNVTDFSVHNSSKFAEIKGIKAKQEVKYMARNSNSSNNSSSDSKSKLQSFKSEVASSLNIDLKQGYNGDLTSREAGTIGGEMVKRMIAYAEKNLH